jgi:hypothetical protein
VRFGRGRERHLGGSEIVVDQASRDHSVAQFLTHDGEPRPQRGDQTPDYDANQTKPRSTHFSTIWVISVNGAAVTITVVARSGRRATCLRFRLRTRRLRGPLSTEQERELGLFV